MQTFDTQLEEPVTVKEAAAEAGVNCDTLRKWIHYGVRGICLEACRRGGRIVTSKESLARFFRKLSVDERDAVRYAAPEHSLEHQLAVADLTAHGW